MAAPGVVFSAVFGIPLAWAVALIGVPTVIYTMVGGVQREPRRGPVKHGRRNGRHCAGGEDRS